MTIFLRALWGPFGRTETGVRGRPYQIDWGFIGIREDNSVGHWTLRFDPAQRKFTAFASPDLPTAAKLRRDARAYRGVLIGPISDPDTYVPNRPMVYGRTYVDIFRPRLSPEDVAVMTRAALAAR